MELRDTLDIAMFGAMCVMLVAGFPVALTLAGVALLFAVIGVAVGAFDFSILLALPNRIFQTTQNETLIAVPLFVFMGVMLEKSRVAEDLLESMGHLFGRIRGGLGISVFLVGALLAASTGIVGATVVTMGLIALPTMIKHGYDRGLASGAIAASGTLGQIIPPSIVLVLLGDVIRDSYQQAQLKQGIFSPETVTVGDFFAGALIPGLVLVGLYMAYMFIIAIIRPSRVPAVQTGAHEPWRKALKRSLVALVAPVVLIVAVLGSILGGLATPTEAAAIGALGAIMLAGFKLVGEKGKTRTGGWPIIAGALAIAALLVLTQIFDLRLGLVANTDGERAAILAALVLFAVAAISTGVALMRTLRFGVLRPVMEQTAQITAMVFLILIGAAFFSLVFRGFGGDETIHQFLTSLPGGVTGAVIVVMLVMFLLGFFIDFIEIVFIVVPVVAPILLLMGVDPIWLGVMMAMNLQTSFLTPPFGFALFYLRGVAPPEVRTVEIYRGVLPFIGLQILMLVMLAFWPGLATWLPETMSK